MARHDPVKYTKFYSRIDLELTWSAIFLRNYFSKGKTPIVFVITEGNSNFGTSTKLFPTQLQQTVSLWTIR